MPPPTPGLFTRQASGLVRELGVRDAFSVGIGGISPASFPFVIFLAVAAFPQTDLTVPLLIGAAVSVLTALTYSQLVTTLPRSGGDYVYASRVFSPFFGAALGGALFIALCLGIGPVPVLIATQFIPYLVNTLGDVFHIHSWTTLAISSQTTELIVTLCVVGFCFLISLRRTVTVTRVTFLTFIGAALALVIASFIFLFTSSGSFAGAFNAFAHSPGSYGRVIASAHHLGLQTGVKTSAVLSTTPFAALVFLGLTFGVLPGGEIRRPSNTYLWSVMAALAATTFLTIFYWLTLRGAVGLHFIQSSGWLSSTNPAAYGKATPVVAFPGEYGLIAAGDPVTKIIMGFGFIAGVIGNVLAYVLVISRLIFALSFDRLIPQWAASVREKSHTPVIATVIATLGIIAVCLLAIYTSVLTVFRNVTLIFLVIYVISSFAAAILPYRRRDLYEASPKLFGSAGKVPVITIVGGASVIANGIIAYLAAVKPQVSGGYSTGSIITLAAVAGVGAVAYVISRLTLRRQGVDLKLAMTELPPE